MNRRQTKQIDARIKTIKKAAQELKALSAEIPAIDRNAERILASVKMLEINFSDLLDLKTPDPKTIDLGRQTKERKRPEMA